LIGVIENALANSRFLSHIRRAFTSRLPFMVLASDVRDVVYANWVVPVSTVKFLVPPGVEIMEKDGNTVLTVLTYEHGHFGPAIAGVFRRLFPSPLQSNWRLYVRSIDGKDTDVPTALFVANVFNSDLYAVGTRVFSDVMLSHRAERFEHRQEGCTWSIRIGGKGSAPSLTIKATASYAVDFPAAFGSFFNHYDDAIEMLCLQDAAIAPVIGTGAIAKADIALPIDTQTVMPLDVVAYLPGNFLEKLGAVSSPFCFRVPAVKFEALSEQILSLWDEK